MRVLNRVEDILRNDPHSRNSDKRLLLVYWRRQGLVLTPEQMRAFMFCTSAESITRARRHLRPKYPAAEAVTAARFDKYSKYKNDGAVETIREGE